MGLGLRVYNLPSYKGFMESSQAFSAAYPAKLAPMISLNIPPEALCVDALPSESFGTPIQFQDPYKDSTKYGQHPSPFDPRKEGAITVMKEAGAAQLK